MPLGQTSGAIRIDSYDLEYRRLACGYHLLFQSFQSSRKRPGHRLLPPFRCHGRRRPPVRSVPRTSIISSVSPGPVTIIVSPGLSLGGASSASSRSKRRDRFRLGMFVPGAGMCSGAPALKDFSYRKTQSGLSVGVRPFPKVAILGALVVLRRAGGAPLTESVIADRPRSLVPTRTSPPAFEAAERSSSRFLGSQLRKVATDHARSLLMSSRQARSLCFTSPTSTGGIYTPRSLAA